MGFILRRRGWVCVQGRACAGEAQPPARAVRLQPAVVGIAGRLGWEKKIPSPVCSPEIPPCFFLCRSPRLFSIPAKRRSGSGRSCACPLQNAVCPSRCHRCGVFGTRGAPRDAGSGWWGCVGEHRRGPGERSTTEAVLYALPCLDGQVCSATPVPPRPAPGFRRVCLGELPAPCQDVK